MCVREEGGEGRGKRETRDKLISKHPIPFFSQKSTQLHNFNFKSKLEKDSKNECKKDKHANNLFFIDRQIGTSLDKHKISIFTF